MGKIAFLGTGMMGAGFIEAALRRGDSVTAWNRTRERTHGVQRLGARIAGDVAEAVRDAERIHLALSDDASVDDVLTQILPAVKKTTPIVDHTTVSPQGTVARYARCDALGFEFLHAPVFMSPQGCRDATGIMLASGPAERFARLKPALEKMTGELWFVGERVDKAAAIKLLGNEMLFFITAGLADVFALARAMDISPADAHDLFSHFKPGVTIDIRGAKMVQGNFDSSFDLSMAKKDIGLMLEAAKTGDVPLAVLPSIARRFDEMIDRGYGSQDVAVIAADAVRGRETVAR